MDVTQQAFVPIFTPRAGCAMSVAFFASGGPGNLATALEVERAHPGLFQIDIVITDRPAIPAIELAQQHGRACLVLDFKAECGPAPNPQQRELWRAYARRREELHDRILTNLESITQKRGYDFDLAVLAYRRVITGPLLRHFSGRMINQHPADLAQLDAEGRRWTVGIGGHARSLRAGRRSARTSTILVREGVDTGEILVRGPSLAYTGAPEDLDAIEQHEQQQKATSDRPALREALLGIARGRFGISPTQRHPDGCCVVGYDGRALPYGGLDLDAPTPTSNGATHEPEIRGTP